MNNMKNEKQWQLDGMFANAFLRSPAEDMRKYFFTICTNILLICSNKLLICVNKLQFV